ncbi:hypothetical protein BRC94_05265 [Halobacteriales archaeon QS_5_70_17]|nr:MAG: hypothetical protein BRC94_05265 [Halobacteriales archaeon QS_5_70_17]
MPQNRRRFLRTTALGATAAFAGASAGIASADHLHEVVSITDPVPENLALDWNGDLYVGITGGSVRRLPADRTGETGLDVDRTEQVAEYPGGVAGVLVDDGVLYTAVNGESGGVYALDLRADGAEPEALATLFPDGDGFVNDLYADGSRLLVTESLGGTVYEVPLNGFEPSVWADDDLLDTPSFGANGGDAVRGHVFVTVTRVTDGKGRIVRFPVECDGGAGDPETYAEGPDVAGADGITSRGAGPYVALNAQNRVVRLVDGKLRTVLAGGRLSFPSEVVFDPTDPETAFVCNFSNERPEQGGVLRGRI